MSQKQSDGPIEFILIIEKQGKTRSTRVPDNRYFATVPFNESNHFVNDN